MIKTKIIETVTSRVMVIGGIPYGAGVAYVKPTNTLYVNSDHMKLFKGEWNLLGKLSEITEEQSKKIVRTGSYRNTFWNYIANDTHKSNQLKSAGESLLSLIESKISLNNPIGIKPFYESGKYSTPKDFIDAKNKWYEEQRKVFTNPILFVEYK